MIRKFALIFGILFMIAGIVGFIPALTPHSKEMSPIAVDSFYGRALGLFPVNILHNRSLDDRRVGPFGFAKCRGIAHVRKERGGFLWPAYNSRIDSGHQNAVRIRADLRSRHLAAWRVGFDRGLFRFYRSRTRRSSGPVEPINQM